MNPANTAIALEIDPLGIPWWGARVRDFTGELVVDPKSDLVRLAVRINARSIDSGEADWNARLQSPEWFGAKRFPNIRYASTGPGIRTRDRWVLAGELVIRDIRRPVVLTVNESGCALPSASDSHTECRFKAHARVRRSEFGLPHGFWEGGDRVDISVWSVHPLEATSR
ncbi:MAG: YceI family protein [Sinobacteraceae bacterium]|nr:YceI family protein [Nevskiaceae bacterium]